METQFTWKTKAFSKKFELFRYDQPAGELKKEGFSRKTYGEMNNCKLVFETKGFLKHRTEILTRTENNLLGTITYNLWKTKSEISYNNKLYQWQFDSFWQTRWSLGNENGSLVRYHVKGFKGTIDSYTDDPVLILTGFFIRNFYRQRQAQAAAAT